MSYPLSMSWLIMAHIDPAPDRAAADLAMDAVAEALDNLFPAEYSIDIAAVLATNFEVISMDDLEDLTSSADLEDWSDWLSTST